jgi:hypothetical protein
MAVPRTIGQLRQLQSTFPPQYRGIDPRCKDSDPLEEMNTGGMQTAELFQAAQGLNVDDVLAVLAKPTPNSFLARRRSDQGVRAVKPGTSGPQTRMVPGRQPPGGGPSPVPASLSSVDWRQRFGWPWITSLQTQQCSDCWCFA